MHLLLKAQGEKARLNFFPGLGWKFSLVPFDYLQALHL